jgi:microcystin-dependent protein
VPFGLDTLGGATAAGTLPANGTYIKGTSPGNAGGEQAHILTVPEMPSHSHSLTIFANTGGSGANLGSAGPWTQTPLNTSSSGGDGAHNTIPPALMTNYIVKY